MNIVCLVNHVWEDNTLDDLNKKEKLPPFFFIRAIFPYHSPQG